MGLVLCKIIEPFLSTIPTLPLYHIDNTILSYYYNKNSLKNNIIDSYL